MLSQDIAWRCSLLSGELRERGERIGDSDLWIAATALEHGVELVTRNADHFQRVSGLHIVAY